MVLYPGEDVALDEWYGMGSEAKLAASKKVLDAVVQIDRLEQIIEHANTMIYACEVMKSLIWEEFNRTGLPNATITHNTASDNDSDHIKAG